MELLFLNTPMSEYSELYWLITNNGFGIFVAVVLLWDKIKTNGSLMTAVENNTMILKDLKDYLLKGGR